MKLRMWAIAAALTLANTALAQSADPDLVVTAVSSPSVLMQGATASATVTVRNNGLSAAAPFQVSIALTRDGYACWQVIYCDESDDDWFVGSAWVSSGLAAGAETTVSVPIAIPTDFAIDTWNVIGLADAPVLHGRGDVFESNENNNQLLGNSLQIVAPQTGDPDLVVTAVSSPPVLSQGANASTTVTVRNNGFSAAPPFDVSIALTRDGYACWQVIYCDESDDDWFAGSASVSSGLAAGTEITVTVPITIPIDFAIDTWNVIGLADGPVLHGRGKVFESNENNNQLLGAPLVVTAP